MRDLHSPAGLPSDSYTPDFAEAIDGPDPDSPSEEYREAARHFYRLMNQAFWHILYAKDARVASWQVAFALGLSATDGKSQSEVAALLGLKSRAAISKAVTEFQRANGIPPMPGQKSEKARLSKRDDRRKQLNAA